MMVIQLYRFAGPIGEEEQTAKVAMARIGFAMVGKIEIALTVKDQIIGALERMSLDRVEDAFDFSGGEIDALYAAA